MPIFPIGPAATQMRLHRYGHLFTSLRTTLTRIFARPRVNWQPRYDDERQRERVVQIRLTSHLAETAGAPCFSISFALVDVDKSRGDTSASPSVVQAHIPATETVRRLPEDLQLTLASRTSNVNRSMGARNRCIRGSGTTDIPSCSCISVRSSVSRAP